MPAAHGVCAVLPVDAKWPRSESVHMLLFTRSVAVEYVPSSHGRAADAPSLQNDPCEHALHAVAPARSWKVPPAHFEHVAAPC